MSSGQWEVVRARNDRRSKVPIPKTAGKQNDTKSKKTNILNGVKIEEVLPKSQIQNLYSGKQSNKENKPQEKTKASESKKPEKKANKVSSDPPKPKPPKSIEAGLLAISSEEFKSVFDESKKRFSTSQIVWLQDLTQFLNQKIPVEISDPVFSNKPIGYPLKVMPAALKATLEQAIKEAGKSNVQSFFDVALTSMVSEMNRGFPAVGYRFILPYIALNEPQMIADNLPRYVSFRVSYQNTPKIALTILWLIGHVGVNDFQCGLRVFEELMLPLIEMKSYSHYIVKYLLDLLSRDYNSHIARDQYMLILDTIYSNRKNFPNELQTNLIEKVPKVKSSLLGNKKEKYHGWVEVLLKKIAASNNPAYQDCLCDILVQIFNNDQSLFASWNKIYSKNLIASAVLIRYISDNQDIVKDSLRKAFKDLLSSFTTVNGELSLKKRKPDGLKEVIGSVKKAQEEKKTSRKHGGGFFRKLLSTLLFALWIAVLTEPLYRLNKPRDELYIFRFGKKVAEATLWVDSKLERNIPKPYYVQAKDFTRPYGALASDLLKVSINVLDDMRSALSGFVNEKYPVVIASIDNYAPGLIDNTQVIFRDAFAKSIRYYHISVNYLQKEVFVGQLSPENIQRVVVRAYNTTSEKAIEYYHWVYEKVQTSIK